MKRRRNQENLSLCVYPTCVLITRVSTDIFTISPALIMSCSSWCKPWKLHGLTVVTGFMMICIVCKIERIITYMYISLTLIYFAMLINYDSTVGFLCVYNRDSRRLWKSLRWLKHAMHHIAFSCLCTWYCVRHMYVCLPSFQETPTKSRYANRIN